VSISILTYILQHVGELGSYAKGGSTEEKGASTEGSPKIILYQTINATITMADRNSCR